MTNAMHKRSGQSLMEILVGVAIGSLFIIGAAVIIAPSLQSNKTASQIQTKTELASELTGNVKSWADGNWSSLLSVATGSTNLYHLMTSASPFVAASGVESVTVGSSTYLRYFYLSDVYRTSGGSVATSSSGNYYDPSTKQLTVGVNLASSTIATTTYVVYLTRNESNILDQADWSGGPGTTSSVDFLGNTFASATNMIYNASDSLSVIPNYVYRRTITVATSEVSTAGGTALTNFPLLVSGTYGFLKASSSAGYVQNWNGYDIIFSSDNLGNNRLKWEIESYSATTGALTAWVQVPTLSSTTNQIYMFYDNPYTSTFQGNASGTWSSGYVGVWHFLSSQGSTLDDSTQNLSNGTWSGNASGTSGYYSAGQVGSWAGYFNGSNDEVIAPTTLTGLTQFTMSAWVKRNTTSSVISFGVGATTGGTPRAEIVLYTNSYLYGEVGPDENTWGSESVTDDTNWHFITFAYNGSGSGNAGKVFLYFDGTPLTSLGFSGTIAASVPTSASLAIGYRYSGYSSGLIDEVQVSNVARSADWISTEYNNQVNPSGFYTISAASTP